MVKENDFSAAVKSFEVLFDYLEHDLPKDIRYILFQFVAPGLLTLVVIYGSLGFLNDIYRWIVPPSAEELHR